MSMKRQKSWTWWLENRLVNYLLHLAVASRRVASVSNHYWQTNRKKGDHITKPIFLFLSPRLIKNPTHANDKSQQTIIAKRDTVNTKIRLSRCQLGTPNQPNAMHQSKYSEGEKTNNNGIWCLPASARSLTRRSSAIPGIGIRRPGRTTLRMCWWCGGFSLATQRPEMERSRCVVVLMNWHSWSYIAV